MKRTIIYLLLAASFGFCRVQVARADEILELKSQMRTMQKQMEQMQEKIEALETEKAEKIETPQEMQERVIALEEKLKEPWAEGILTSGGGKLKLGGKIQIEFVDTQEDDSTGEPGEHIQLGKLRLEPELQISEDISFEADLNFGEEDVSVDEAYFIFDNLPLNSTVKLGKDDRFFKAENYTERYPLAGTAFWRDEEWGILWKTKFKPFYAALSWSQGLEQDFKEIGQDDSGDDYEMLQDDTRKSKYNGIKEISGGLGFKKELGEAGEVDILAWGLYNQLSEDDIETLQGALSGYASEDDKQSRVGVNLEYSLVDFNLVAQYIEAHDGDLDRKAWFVQPSYVARLPFSWKYLNDHRLLVRYGQLNVDHAKTFNTPASWDRDEWTFALISNIVENFRLKTEYTIDDEETGGRDIDNNELVLQLEYEF